MKSFSEWKSVQKLNKPWKATKEEAIGHWQSLPPATPIQLHPIPPNHKGPTYRFDGIRITGSPGFIDSILSRLKDMLNYEGGQGRLEISYRQQVDSKTEQPITNTYVFYAQLKYKEKNTP